jgi:hypothetical protein
MEVRHDPSAPAGGRDVVVEGDAIIAVVRSEIDGARTELALDVVNFVDVVSARSLLECVLARVDTRVASTVQVRCSDDLVRDHASRVGFTAPLRGVLTSAGRVDVAGAVESVDLADLDVVAAMVDQLVPGVSVGPRRGLWRVFELRASSDDGSAVKVRLPRRADLMAEPIAAALDTVFAVKARFGRAASGITKLSFDHGGEALTTGNVAGLAEGAAGVVVLTPNFVSSHLMGDERDRWRAQGRAPRVANADDQPCAIVDGVVAHECWHYLDAEVRSSGRAYVEFNAALGEALGVESLEHALRGRERSAPAEWQSAHAQLVRDVSNYAGTNPREATAEMFSLWWRGRRASPVVARFGELVERHFPE